MLDPQKRWLPLPDKPDYAGFLSFGGAPLAQDPEHLAGVDVAIVGAPTDDLVSDRPGTRYAPRAIRAASCPPGPHLEASIDAFAELRIVDYGDAPVVPADPVRTHEAIERIVGEVHDVRELGVREVAERALEHVGRGPVYLTVDVDVLDPAFAPGTGTPEPGGMTSLELLWAVREISSRADLVGADVVEVLPTAVGSADITALVAERLVREVLTGIAVARSRPVD